MSEWSTGNFEGKANEACPVCGKQSSEESHTNRPLTGEIVGGFMVMKGRVFLSAGGCWEFHGMSLRWSWSCSDDVAMCQWWLNLILAMILKVDMGSSIASIYCQQMLFSPILLFNTVARHQINKTKLSQVRLHWTHYSKASCSFQFPIYSWHKHGQNSFQNSSSTTCTKVQQFL